MKRLALTVAVALSFAAMQQAAAVLVRDYDPTAPDAAAEQSKLCASRSSEARHADIIRRDTLPAAGAARLLSQFFPQYATWCDTPTFDCLMHPYAPKVPIGQPCHCIDPYGFVHYGVTR